MFFWRDRGGGFSGIRAVARSLEEGAGVVRPGANRLPPGKLRPGGGGLPGSLRGASVPAVPLQRGRELPHEGEEDVRHPVVSKGRRVLQKVSPGGTDRDRQAEGRESDRRPRSRDQAPAGS